MRRKDTGAAAVEFAIVAPLTFLLIFGLLAFGLTQVWSALAQHAAQKAARYAAIQCPFGGWTGPVITPPEAGAGAQIDATGSVVVDADGTVHVLTHTDATAMANASAEVPEPESFTTDPANPRRCPDPAANPQLPYPSQADVAKFLVDNAYRATGDPDKVSLDPAAPGSAPKPGDPVTVEVTYTVPGVSGLMRLIGFGENSGTVTRSATARRE
jgi:hypothetical protein